MSFALLRQNDARCHKFRERRFLFTVDRVQKLKVATQSSTEENAAIVAMKNMLFGCLDWLVGWKKNRKRETNMSQTGYQQLVMRYSHVVDSEQQRINK